MTLFILEIFYNSNQFFISYIFDKKIESDSKLLFPKNNDHNFIAFSSLDASKKYFLQLDFEYEREIFTKIDIDNLLNWVKSNEPLKIDFEKLVEFNSFIFDFIMYDSGILPEEFVDKNFDQMRKLVEIYHSKELINLYYESKIKNPQDVNFDVKRIKVFSNNEIKKIIENSELKKEVYLLLVFFKQHIAFLCTRQKT